MTVSPVATREPAWSDIVIWFETIDEIVRGLGHALNNRALALGATIESLDPKRPVGQQLTGGLVREAERLTEQLRQLRSLPFAVAREPMPLLLRDVLAAAIQLHRTHASLGGIPVYLEGSADAAPVLVPESSMIHAVLVTLSALKAFVAPGGVVRVSYGGTDERAEVAFVAERDPSDVHVGSSAAALMPPTALAVALLGGAGLETEQRIGPESARATWELPSLRETRRRQRAGMSE